MAGWFEKLKNVIETKLNLHITVNANRTINTIIIANRKGSIHQSGEATPLETEDLTPDQKKLVQQALREGVEQGGLPLLEALAERTVEEFKKLDQSDEQQKIIAKLKGVIPETDIPILRAALFLSKKFHDKDPAVQDLKEQITNRYGDRGRQFANLASAGYFQGTIIPLLEAMGDGKPEFRREVFLKSYEIIIRESGFALFVHSGMSEEKIWKEVLEKIKSNLKYGIKYLHIHAIGKPNVQNVRKAVAKISEKHPSIVKPIEELTGQVLLIRLEFGPELSREIQKKALQSRIPVWQG